MLGGHNDILFIHLSLSSVNCCLVLLRVKVGCWCLSHQSLNKTHRGEFISDALVGIANYIAVLQCSCFSLGKEGWSNLDIEKPYLRITKQI